VRWVQLSFPRADERFLPAFKSALYVELKRAYSVLQFQIREDEDIAYRHFHCIGWPREEHTLLVQEAWLSALARAVRVYISAKEEELMRHRIVHHGYYNEIAEEEELLQYVFHHVQEREEIGKNEPCRKHRVEQEVIIYLENESVLRLDGFFRFRLREYMKEIYAMVDLSVEQYIIEEEQETLIHQLRSFLLSFPRRSSLLRLIHDSGFSFIYYNEAWEEMKPPASIYLPMEMESPYIEEEIRVIETLAEFAPDQIVMYTRQPSDSFVMMLQRIFAERLTVCTEFSFPAHVVADT
jgi:putative sporulation protein YtxC